jgi:hypothetical protein
MRASDISWSRHHEAGSRAALAADGDESHGVKLKRVSYRMGRRNGAKRFERLVPSDPAVLDGGSARNGLCEEKPPNSCKHLNWMEMDGQTEAFVRD